MGAKKEHMPFFMTNTFLSTYESDHSIVSFTPYAKPYVHHQVRETYLSCLEEARVGIDNYNCKAGEKKAYRDCIFNVSTDSTRQNTLVTNVQRAIGSYGSNVSSIVQLPTQLTSLSKADELKAFLADNNNRILVKKQLAVQSSPVATAILKAIVRFESATGPLACADAVQASLDSPQAHHYDVGKVLLGAWDCTADFLITEPIQKIAYEKCIPFEVWPTHDIMQTQYSLTLLGSYNKQFLLIVGGWIMASFVVYTLPGMSSGATSNGKPDNWLARAGKVFVLFSFAWNVGAVVMVLVRGFMPGDSWENFPMSIQTVLLSAFLSVSASIYFGREIYELFIRGGDVSPRVAPAPTQGSSETQPMVSDDAVASNGSLQMRYHNNRRYQALNGFMRVSGYSSAMLSEAQYTPLVVPAWNDAWFFVDSALFLGIVGLSKDVVTADVVVVVLCILLANLMNSALVRLLYEGYVNEVPETSKALFDQYKIRNASRSDVFNNKTALYAIRVMAMVASITSFLLSLIALILVQNRYEIQLPTWYIAFSFFVPQVLWLVFNLLLDFGFVTDASTFYYINSIMFSFNVLIRSVFLAVNWGMMYDDYKLTVDKSDSLNNLLEYIQTDKQ